MIYKRNIGGFRKVNGAQSQTVTGNRKWDLEVEDWSLSSSPIELWKLLKVGKIRAIVQGC